MRSPPTQISEEITAVSLFSGCGGFDWGAQQAGVKILWANDVDWAAATVYEHLFPDVDFHKADIRKIENFPKADILIGCYPCTGFSMGARRRAPGQEDARDLKSNDNNFLYQEFLRALKQVQPKYLFVENVSGMVSADDGWFLDQQIQGFDDAGYIVKKEYLVAADFGVPQQRKRLFLAGVRKDIAQQYQFEYQFPKPTHGGPGQPKYVSLRRAIGHMPAWPTGEFDESAYPGHYLTRRRKKRWDEVSYTIVANSAHVPLHPQGWQMKPAGKDKYLLQGSKNRRLSWRECAVIQGLPHEQMPADMPLTSIYRVVGNAVPPTFGNVLLRPVVDFERQQRGLPPLKRPPVCPYRNSYPDSEAAD